MSLQGFSAAFCNALLRFYNVCYRHGIEDGCQSGDLGECEEAVDRLKDLRNFGTVTYEMDWNEWQFKALQWTRDDICRARTMDLIMSLRVPSRPLGFLLQIAKLYYVRGVRDWMDCYDWLAYDTVIGLPNYPYILKRAHSYRNSTLQERFEMLQTVCFNLIELQQAYLSVAGPYVVAPSKVRTLVERVWGAMQKRRWFDDCDIEDYARGDVKPTHGVRTDEITESDLYTDGGKGRRKIEYEIKKQRDEAYKNKRKKTDRRVSRKDADRGDAPADGSVLQSGAPKRRRGRPPKNV